VALEIRNVGRFPAALRIPERLSGELAFTTTPPVESVVRRETQATWLHTTVLGPGERLSLPCDLGGWLSFPGPGTYALRAAYHHVVGDQTGALSVSNSFEIRVE
jgi:hypothetical protein